MVSTSSPGQLGFWSVVPQWTSSPRRLGPMLDVPLRRPAVPGDSGPGLKPCWVDQLSRAIRTQVRGPWGRPAVQGYSSPGPMAREVDQLSRATWVRFRGPVGSTRCHGQLGLARGLVVDKLSRATRTGV